MAKMTQKELWERARGLKALVLDFDGVLTDNRELIGFLDGAIIKGRSHYDGQGISLLRDIGLRILIATNENHGNARAAHWLVEKWNKLPSATTGAEHQWPPVSLLTGVGHNSKRDAVLSWLGEVKIAREDCAVMGDDMVDVPLLREVGLRAAPASAEEAVRQMADFISVRPGGGGAVRDLANFILETRNIDPTTLRPF